MIRICRKCGIPKDLEKDFYKSAGCVDGRRYDCKACCREYNQANKEKRNAYYRKYNAEHPEIVQKVRQKWLSKPENKRKRCILEANYDNRNKEKVLERKRLYYEANTEVILEKNRTYATTEKGKAARVRINANRRQREFSVEQLADLTDMEWAEILQWQKNRCAACLIQFSDNLFPTRDHIVPVAKGGALTKDNVQGLCQSCNSKKHDKTIDYRESFYERLSIAVFLMVICIQARMGLKRV